MIATGNHFWDRVTLRLILVPDGALDSPPTWVVDDPLVNLTVSPDGLTCDALADVDVAAFAITATAPVDNPTTPELENVSETFVGSFTHSKATTLGGTFVEIPR